MSTTSTFLTRDFLRAQLDLPLGPCMLVSGDLASTVLTRSLEDRGFGCDHAHQIGPRFDERFGALVL